MSRLNPHTKELISFLPQNKMYVKSKFIEVLNNLNFSTDQINLQLDMYEILRKKLIAWLLCRGDI
jgi:hypothetical protein